MFNAPRASQPYGASSSNGFGTTSFVVDNPLASSVYDSDGLDPWSTSPSPAPPALPPATSSIAAPAGFSTVIGQSFLYNSYPSSHHVVSRLDRARGIPPSIRGCRQYWLRRDLSKRAFTSIEHIQTPRIYYREGTLSRSPFPGRYRSHCYRSSTW